MDPKSGAIATFETENDARKAGYTLKLSAEQFHKFSGMNRHDRRAQIAQNRKQRRAKK